VFRRDPVLDRETLDGIIRMLMRIDANVAELVEREDDGEEDERNALPSRRSRRDSPRNASSSQLCTSV